MTKPSTATNHLITPTLLLQLWLNIRLTRLSHSTDMILPLLLFTCSTTPYKLSDLLIYSWRNKKKRRELGMKKNRPFTRLRKPNVREKPSTSTTRSSFILRSFSSKRPTGCRNQIGPHLKHLPIVFFLPLCPQSVHRHRL